jgi:hypothetical protein
MWHVSWESIATPSAAGWRGMPLGGWRPCWQRTSPPANRSRSHQRCSPVLSRPSSGPKALPRMKRSGNGCARPTGWRSKTQRSTPWCARASRPSSKWPDQATQKTPEAIPAFQAACGERLQEVIPPANTRPVRVFSPDESRVGLLTIRRRRLTARGVPPVGSVQHGFEWGYVYGAVEPTTGARFCLELPYLNAEMCQLFVHACAQAFPDSLNILLLDTSGAHTSSQLTLPEHVRCVFLPPYCPELNPMERVWRDLKDALAWLHFTDQTQRRYEVIRPLLLFEDRTATQRAQETKTHPDTVRTFLRRFRQQGMLGLLPDHVDVSTRGRASRVPEAVRQEIARLNALYRGFHYREVVRILFYKYGYRLHPNTVKQLWQQCWPPAQGEFALGDYHRQRDRYEARVQVIKLYIRAGISSVSVASYMSRVRRWIGGLRASRLNTLRAWSTRAPRPRAQPARSGCR